MHRHSFDVWQYSLAPDLYVVLAPGPRGSRAGADLE
jgi:hypothetical protein